MKKKSINEGKTRHSSPTFVENSKRVAHPTSEFGVATLNKKCHTVFPVVRQ